MGSLMAGWDSHVPDPKSVKYQRNRSLTRDEIDTYWNSKKQKNDKDDDQLKVVCEEAPKMNESATQFQRSSSLPLTNTKGSFFDFKSTADHEVSFEKMILKNGWWISTSSAFLNEPPVIEDNNVGAKYKKYASQFHVANINASDRHHGPADIST